MASYTRPQLEKLKVTDLKEILRSNGQKMVGTKAELVDRVLTTAGTRPPRSPPRVSVGIAAEPQKTYQTTSVKKTPKKTTKKANKTPTKTMAAIPGSAGFAAISRQRIENNRVPLVPIVPTSPNRVPIIPVVPTGARSPPRSPNRVPIIPVAPTGSARSPPRSPNRVPIIPVPPTSSVRASSPVRVASPGRVVITPSVSAGSPSRASTASMAIPETRSGNLAASAQIKAIHYDLPPLTVDWNSVPPRILEEIEWMVNTPLLEARLAGNPYADLDVGRQRDLNETIIPSPTHSIHIEGIDVDDPNGAPANQLEDAFATLELSSPDEYPLTQWQVLKGLEKYYQWFMARNGGPLAIGDHQYFDGLQHIGQRHGIPVYQMFLGS